jgi:hypothetical protein
MRIGVAVATLFLAVPALASCATASENPTAANSGDCSGSIRFHGVVYVADTRLNQAARPGRAMGPGAVVDCDRRTVVDRVVVSAVKGADSHLAIRVRRGTWHGIYVAQNLSRTHWPAVLRQDAPDDGVETVTPARASLPCPVAVQRELIGRRHVIVGASFAWPQPFMAPPLADRHNKILWQLQRSGHAADTADLLIAASLNGSELVVRRRVQGRGTPGRTRPSIIDVPKPGCWTFSLAWGDERDTVSVRYRSSG